MRSEHFPLRTTAALLVIVSGLGIAVSRRNSVDVPAPRVQSPDAVVAIPKEQGQPARLVDPDPIPEVTVSGNHALLVGVTFYENLEKRDHLDGPENDTLLIRELLTKRYSFPEPNVRILSEHAGHDKLPTRKNIEREFKRLAEVVEPGNQVVVVMGGHGSLQPQNDHSRFPQPDGCDRIFLPRDVAKWDGESGHVPNAIRGDELGGWLRPIADKKASVFLVLDACHSGSGVRAVDEERSRQLDPVAKGGLEIPVAAMASAAKIAAEREPLHGHNKPGAPEASALPLPRMDGVAVLYACQSTETTVEKPLPVGAPDCKNYGLMTFTINQILTRAEEPLTYLELAQRIQGQYSGWGRNSPTPMLEAKDQNREVLGLKSHPRRSLIRLVTRDHNLKVTYGAIHGLATGSVLAVYPPAGAKGGKPLGYVRVTEVETSASTVEPCQFNEQPANDMLPDQGRCEVVAIDYGDMKVRVTVDPLDNHGKPVSQADRDRLRAELITLAGKEASILSFVSDPGKADWLLRIESGKVYLVPASGLAVPAAHKVLPPLFGPYLDDQKLSATLADRLGRIARVQNLKKLATDPAAELTRSRADDTTDPGVTVKLEIRLLQNKADKQGQPIAWPASGIELFNADLLQFRVHNPNPFPVDVTLLYIDGDCGINCLYPLGGEVSRLETKTTRRINTKVYTDALVQEHLVVIAVKSQKLQQPVDFACLEQSSLEKAKDVGRTRGGTTALQTPLGKRLQHSLYGNRTESTRGASRSEVEESAMFLCTWHVVPGKRP